MFIFEYKNDNINNVKFNFNKQDISKLETLFETNEINMMVSDFYSSFIENQNLDIKIDQTKSKQDQIISSFIDFLDLDLNDKKISKLINRTKLNKITLLNPNDFKSNHYYKNVKPDLFKDFNFCLTNDFYYPYECFIYKDTSTYENDYFIEINHFAFFDTKFPYLVLKQNNIPWMSLTPNEILTMEKPINNAYGNVVTFGLGLGYFTYMCLLKEDVKKVIVVEKNPSIIKLFKSNLLSQFPNQDKLEIINQDAFDFLNNKNNFNDIDYLFLDTYHTANDGISMYLKFKSKQDKYLNTTFTYWIENSLKCFFRRIVITYIKERYYNFDVNYDNTDDEIDYIFYRLNIILKDIKFNCYNDVYQLLIDENLDKLAKQIY